MKYKKYNLKNFNVYAIETDNFKNCHAEIIFYDDLKKEDITKRCFLNTMLTYTNEDYKTKIAKNIRLEELYDFGFYAETERVGNTICSTFNFDFLAPKYADKKFLGELLDFVFNALNKPNIVNNSFDEASFKAVKNIIESDIKAFKESPGKVAFWEAIKAMDETSSLTYIFPGTLASLNKITPQNLYNYYQKAFKNIHCDILLIGNLDIDEAVNEIKQRFPFKGDKNYQLKIDNVFKEVDKEQVVNKKANYNQSILEIGYNANGLTKKEKYITAMVVNEILSGGFEGKLYKHLRLDNSLCYYTYATPRPYDNILLICAGINKANYAQSVKLIKKTVNELKKGIITKDELNNAKTRLISFLDTITDKEGTLIFDYYRTSLGILPTIKERREGVKSTTIKDIIKVAKKLKINTIFFLEGDTNDQKN